MPDLRTIPPVNQLLESEQAKNLVEKYGRQQVLAAVRMTLDEMRADLPEGKINSQVIFQKVESKLQTWFTPTLQSVINATGVILHTNLGRAPLSQSAIQAMVDVGSSYSTLEFDLKNGKRGSRSVHAEEQLKRLLNTDTALVVNNNAAAVLLCLTALAKRRKVVISRTQLVEIGGGFRVPDVMKQSGAILHEIGTTNRVHISDYENALQDNPGLVLRAHHSNYKIIGFTSEPGLNEIVDQAHQHQVPIMDDLGSGSLIDTTLYGLGHEPTVQESLAAGADIVCFSGDKLLGGPQAGIIVGRKELVDKIKKHPLARAVRADKLCLAALSATLDHYLRGEAERQIPVWHMISKSETTLHETANRWQAELVRGKVIAGKSTVGGGSLPEETLPTWLLGISVPNPDRFLADLRNEPIPVIARIENDMVVFDPRTVFHTQEETLLQAIKAVLQQP